MKIRVFVPPVALHPSLYGAAEMGLRRFIENPLGTWGRSSAGRCCLLCWRVHGMGAWRVCRRGGFMLHFASWLFYAANVGP